MNEWAAVGSAALAAVGLFFTAWQLTLANRQAREERRLGLEGVVVVWRVISNPTHAGPDGTADWTYEITVANPGRFPIDHVSIRWVFPCLVRRLHHDREPDPPTHEVRLGTPVLAGGGSQKWTRHLQINYGEAKALPDTYAVVNFNDINGEPRTNTWPRPKSSRAQNGRQ